MSDHLTRKELKQDNVALKVEQTFNFVSLHKQQAIRMGGALVALIVIVAAVFYYRSSQKTVRAQMLGDAITLQGAPVGAAPPNGSPSFPTEAAKKDAVAKSYSKIISEHSGSNEAYISEYSLASIDTENGKLDDARKKYQDVADHAEQNYASLAKLALAQLDFAENRVPEAEAILKDLSDHPTDLVSKNQATFALAKGLIPTKPEEARKLLIGMASAASDISQVAVAAMQDLPQQ